MGLKDLENTISEQLGFLQHYSGLLRTIGESIAEDQFQDQQIEDEDNRFFENLIIRNLDNITHILRGSQLEHSATQTESAEDHRGAEAAETQDSGARRQESEEGREQRAIDDNAEFMEELQEEIRPDDVFVVVDEVVGAEVTEENAYHEEALAPKDTSETRRLNEEILRVLTEKRDLERRIHEMANEKTCPRRRFEAGQIRNENETTMPCVFCGLIGVHYSDACDVYPDTRRRWRIIREAARCRGVSKTLHGRT
ncbi:hypothetical protein RB195_017741 [Necator americanus]|uniref:Uncharacterized protein n=1 Tax=Necator americanus TaxID=51031 RepID=A0ABR1C9J2_NECAM